MTALVFEPQLKLFCIAAQRDFTIKTALPAGMAGNLFTSHRDTHPETILIAIYTQADQFLRMAAGRALVPEFLAAA